MITVEFLLPPSVWSFADCFFFWHYILLSSAWSQLTSITEVIIPKPSADILIAICFHFTHVQILMPSCWNFDLPFDNWTGVTIASLTQPLLDSVRLTVRFLTEAWRSIITVRCHWIPILCRSILFDRWLVCTCDLMIVSMEEVEDGRRYKGSAPFALVGLEGHLGVRHCLLHLLIISWEANLDLSFPNAWKCNIFCNNLMQIWCDVHLLPGTPSPWKCYKGYNNWWQG